jgi:hypothetical protein
MDVNDEAEPQGEIVRVTHALPTRVPTLSELATQVADLADRIELIERKIGLAPMDPAIEQEMREAGIERFSSAYPGSEATYR